MERFESYEAAVKAGCSDIFKEAENDWRGYMPGEIVRYTPPPEQAKSAIVQEIESSPALTALAAEVAKLKGVTTDALVVSLDSATVKTK